MSIKRNVAAKPAAKTSPAKSKVPAKAAPKASAAIAKNDTVSLEPILAAMRKRLPKARHAETEAFINAFYKRMSSDELPQHSAEGWAELATDFLDFARARKPGSAPVQLFNPTIKNEGWESPHTVVQIVNDDMSFLVDSVSMALAAQGIGVHVLGHPVVTFRRDKAGKLVAVGEGVPESLIHLESTASRWKRCRRSCRRWKRCWPTSAPRSATGSRCEAKMLAIAEDLGSRSMPASDAGKPRRRNSCAGPPTTISPSSATANTKSARRAAQRVLAADQRPRGLGMHARPGRRAKPRPLKGLAAHYMPQSRPVDPLILTKTNARSTVHRPGYMDYIGVLSFDAKRQRRSPSSASSACTPPAPTTAGRGTSRWCASATRRDGSVRAWRRDQPQRQGAARTSSRRCRATSCSSPATKSCPRTAMGILGLQERVRTRLFLRRDRYGRFYSALVYIPRDRFNTDVRERIEAMLMRELHGERLDTIGPDRRIAAGAVAPDRAPEAPASASQVRRRRARGRAGADRAQLARRAARAAWCSAHGEETRPRAGQPLRQGAAGRLHRATSRRRSRPSDVEHAGRAARRRRPAPARCTAPAAATAACASSCSAAARDIALSDALPMMENMGLRIITEHPYEIDARATAASCIQDFEVEPRDGDVDVDAVDDAFRGRLRAIWRGDAENDGFNRLILAAGLDWRQVAMLRGYCKYLLQTGVPFSQTYMEETLARYPLLARLLVELFEAQVRARPRRRAEAADLRGAAALHAAAARSCRRRRTPRWHDRSKTWASTARSSREAQIDACGDALGDHCWSTCRSLDEDRILRSFIGVINATLRTSYFQTAGDGGTDGLHQLQVRSGEGAGPAEAAAVPRDLRVLARASKACTCASARSRAAACAGRTGARTSAPKCWAWSRRRW